MAGCCIYLHAYAKSSVGLDNDKSLHFLEEKFIWAHFYIARGSAEWMWSWGFLYTVLHEDLRHDKILAFIIL
jgi:hypothetical protein